jgi:hypothetical protein
MWRYLLAVLALAMAPPVRADVVGHYSLQGVMETGSELLLKPDGRFQWYLSVGSLDLVGVGQWQETDGLVMLVPDPETTQRVPFSIGAAEPFDDDAKLAFAAFLMKRLMWEQEDIVRKRCPFGPGQTSAPYLDFAPSSGEQTAEEKQATRLRAEAALATAQHAYAQAQNALDAFAKVETVAADDHPLRAKAITAVEVAETARYRALAFIGAIPTLKIDLQPLRYPAFCSPPPVDPRAIEAAVQSADRPFAVRMMAPGNMIMANAGFLMGFERRDGPVDVQPFVDGWSFTGVSRTNPITRILLLGEDGIAMRGAAFVLKGEQATTVPLIVDDRAQTAMEPMTLKIDGRDLVPQSSGLRGRYVRSR